MDFNFYDLSIAFSMQDTNDMGTPLKQDTLLQVTNVPVFIAGLIEQMHRHPVFAGIICHASYNYMQEGGEVIPLQVLIGNQPKKE